MQRIAFYDMDKTITRRATFGLFIIHVIRRYSPGRLTALPLMGFFAFLYLLGTMSRKQLKERNLVLLVGYEPFAAKLKEMAASFADETLDHNILAPALVQIKADRDEGYRIVLATASYRFYVGSIAERLGIADVIATDLRAKDSSAFMAKIEGENCYGPAKLKMVQNWMQHQGYARAACHIRFYTDHVSDVPCLEWADEAFATNAHSALDTLAEAKGWARIDWLSKG